LGKLKAPLLSLGASGAIGKALVFFPWKGLDCVREYVTPSNPKTSGQTTQRGYLAAAVAKIHSCLGLAADPLGEDDKVAYAVLAGTRPNPRTWFNEIVKLWCDCKVLGDIPIIYCAGTISDASRVALDMEIDIEEETPSSLVAGKFYFGTSKTGLIHAVAATVTAGDCVALVAEDLSAWMTVGVKYYVQFRPDAADPCEGADSGIYTFVAEA